MGGRKVSKLGKYIGELHREVSSRLEAWNKTVFGHVGRRGS